MFNRRFMPYIVGVCIVALISLSYVGYRAYQSHVEFETFIADAQEGFNRSVEGHHSHSSEALPYVSQRQPLQEREPKVSESNHQKESEHDEAIFVSEGSVTKIETDMPMDKEYLEIQQWVMTGETTPYIEQKLKERAESQLYLVNQRVVTPDGQIHTVVVHRNYQYKEGDKIFKSQIEPPDIEPIEHASIIIDDVEYDLPDEYYSIDDPYERRVYSKKFWWSVENGVSMAEVEKKVGKGELDFSLSQAEKGYIDEEVAREERHRLLLEKQKLPVSNKPPVKVSFLPDEGEGALPGWRQKGESPGPENVSEGNRPLDTETAPGSSDSPLSPSDLPDMVEPTPSRPSEPRTEAANKTLTLPTAESIKAQLREQLSPERFDKVQQLIDQYGTEEGLRRLRESAPDAAERFERERLRSERLQSSEPSRDAPDGEQSER